MILFLTMFVLIYGPKVAGLIDTLSLFSFGVICCALLLKSYRYLSWPSRRRVGGYILLFTAMAIYTMVVVFLTGLTDYYQPLRFSRALLNTLGIAALISLYYRKYGQTATNLIIYHVWLCIVAHGLLIVAMFTSQSLNEFVVDVVVRVSPESGNYADRLEGNRISGLTNSWDATSAIQSMAILMLPLVYRLRRGIVHKTLVAFSVPLSIFAMTLSGLTGFVVLAIGTVFLLFMWGGLKFKVVFLSSFLIIFISSGFFLYGVSKGIYGLEDTSIARTAFMIFGGDSAYAKQNIAPSAGDTVKRISDEMYFLPDSPQAFFIGLGGGGRSESNYIIKADPGLTLNLHNLGFFATLLIYSLVIFEVVRAFRCRIIDRNVSLFSVVILATIILVDLKVQYLLSRNSLSFMMIAMILVWQARSSSNTNSIFWRRSYESTGICK